MTGHPSRSWSDKGGRFAADPAEGTPSRWGTADPRDGVAYLWCDQHETDPSRVDAPYAGEEPDWFDPFAWLGGLLDDLFGAEDPHADYRARHPGAEPTMRGPCCGPSDGAPLWGRAEDDDAAEAGR